MSHNRRFTIEQRADRWQRRFTGPWETLSQEIGPVNVSWRRRYRRKIEFVRLDVAWHDLWVQDIGRPLASWLRRKARRTA